MRLIDADELGASVIKNTVFDKGDVIKLIETAPTIDIVFCKDCISADEKPIADGRYWCNIHGSFMYYCSDGQKGESGGRFNERADVCSMANK